MSEDVNSIFVTAFLDLWKSAWFYTFRVILPASWQNTVCSTAMSKTSFSAGKLLNQKLRVVELLASSGAARSFLVLDGNFSWNLMEQWHPLQNTQNTHNTQENWGVSESTCSFSSLTYLFLHLDFLSISSLLTAAGGLHFAPPTIKKKKN